MAPRPLSLVACLLLALTAIHAATALATGSSDYFPFPGPAYESNPLSATPALPFPSPARGFGVSPFASSPEALAAASSAGFANLTSSASLTSPANDDVPYPFTRVLQSGSEGNDVVVLQGLLSQIYPLPTPDGKFGQTTMAAVQVAQEQLGLPVTGRVTSTDAHAFLKAYSFDKWRDPLEPSDGSWKYKMLFQVSTDRTKETVGMLLGPDNTVHYRFTARLRGHTDTGKEDWPEWNSEKPGLNQFTTNGNTPTGLGKVDLNSEFAPEVQHLYGPYPVNRIVSGLKGNMGFLLPQVRSGILIHTGKWKEASGWTENYDMPNSAGCIHIHPDDCRAIADILVKRLGVEVRKNPGGVRPYPYVPQGLISVEEVPVAPFFKP